jgi:hypothetical protein
LEQAAAPSHMLRSFPSPRQNHHVMLLDAMNLGVTCHALIALQLSFSGVSTYCNFGVELLTILPISKVSYYSFNVE